MPEFGERTGQLQTLPWDLEAAARFLGFTGDIHEITYEIDTLLRDGQEELLTENQIRLMEQFAGDNDEGTFSDERIIKACELQEGQNTWPKLAEITRKRRAWRANARAEAGRLKTVER
jgi:hypothetical protein